MLRIIRTETAAERRFGLTLRGTWLTPVGGAVIAFIALRSAFRAATGQTFTWKGRQV